MLKIAPVGLKEERKANVKDKYKKVLNGDISSLYFLVNIELLQII